LIDRALSEQQSIFVLFCGKFATAGRSPAGGLKKKRQIEPASTPKAVPGLFESVGFPAGSE
jgi:hypothetical protein